MFEKNHLDLEGIFGVARPLALVGLVLLIALAIVINTGLASRNSQTDKQAQQPSSQCPSPAPIPSATQTDPTMGWVAYTDSVGGFSISFPPDWHLEEGQYVYPTKTYWELTWRKSFEMDAPWIALGVWDNPQQLSTHEWVKAQYERLTGQRSFEGQTSQKGIAVAGIPSLEIRGFPNDGVGTVFVPYRSKMYEITLGAGSGEGGAPTTACPQDEEVFNLMLDSLRFSQQSHRTD